MTSPLAKIFNRPPGRGWIVLTGGPTPDAQMLRVLEIADRAGTIVALVPHAGDLALGDEVLAAWLVLSGRPGSSVDCETGDCLEDTLGEASIILLPDLSSGREYAESIGETDAVEYLLTAVDDGALILAEGCAAEAMGDAVEEHDPAGNGETIGSGLSWIPSVIIQSHFTTNRKANILQQRPNLLRMGLPAGTGLAMGPEGEREIWGDQTPILTFGIGWIHER